MKQRCLLINLLVYLLVLNLSSCQKRITIGHEGTLANERTRLIVDEQHNVKPPIAALLKLTGLEEKTTLHDVVEVTQKSWLRAQGQERMHLAEQYAPVAQEMLQHFTSLGLVSSIMPREKSYDYVFLLGSTFTGVKERLSFLESLAKNGIHYKTLVLLGSHRPLDRFYEIEPMLKETVFENMPVTEIEMMEALFARSSLKGASKQVLPIASPMKVLADKRIVRANTLDTVLDFLRMKKRPGSVLVISSQPYVLRQHFVVQKTLGPLWRVETVGSAASPQLKSSIYLDELARTLFEIETITTNQGR